VAKLPVLVEGILRGDDALRSVNHGASGIIRVKPWRGTAGRDSGDYFDIAGDRRRGGRRGRSLR
jgi:hypothetical protein